MNTTCVGCGGESEPLVIDDMCKSCVELDARVDEHGPETNGLLDITAVMR